MPSATKLIEKPEESRTARGSQSDASGTSSSQRVSITEAGYSIRIRGNPSPETVAAISSAVLAHTTGEQAQEEKEAESLASHSQSRWKTAARKEGIGRRVSPGQVRSPSNPWLDTT